MISCLALCKRELGKREGGGLQSWRVFNPNLNHPIGPIHQFYPIIDKSLAALAKNHERFWEG